MNNLCICSAPVETHSQRVLYPTYDGIALHRDAQASTNPCQRHGMLVDSSKLGYAWTNRKDQQGILQLAKHHCVVLTQLVYEEASREGFLPDYLDHYHVVADVEFSQTLWWWRYSSATKDRCASPADMSSIQALACHPWIRGLLSCDDDHFRGTPDHLLANEAGAVPLLMHGRQFNQYPDAFIAGLLEVTLPCRRPSSPSSPQPLTVIAVQATN